MSRIDELVTKLCPDGVEFRQLLEAAPYSRTRVDATELDGTTFVGVDNLLPNKGGKVDASYLPNTARLTAYEVGDVLLGNIRPYLKKVWLATSQGGCSGDVLALRVSPSFRARLLPRFLYYAISSDEFFAYDMQHAKGAKMPRGNTDAILKYRIPIPPVEVQNETVRVLDLFTSLEAELEAELKERRRQYEHYRDSLLTFAEGRDVRWVMLSDVATFRRGTAITAKDTATGDVPVVANGPVAIYFHNDSNRSGETIVVARSGAYAGSVSFWDQPIFLTDAFSIHPDIHLLKPKFVYHWLRARQKHLHSMKKGSGVPHVRIKDVESYKIPIPTPAEQDRIVATLDKFDTLVNDLSIGLPAELNARRRQYEHYRDRLLTFREAA